ncbi:DUF1499 domain-containing protein [Pseudooceanicola nanhaiensis]|uniref:DUF1499 domain-containing protein n=1 Tax=Pseudooceanicola nanhaiensis TaxID=375761 RepID=UPI0040596351
MWWVIVGLIVVVAGLQAWIRLAPSHPEDWHVAPRTAETVDMPNRVQRAVPAGNVPLERIDRIIRATPRTETLAGSPRAGLITYVTRSRVWGFPDYTTVTVQDGQLVIFARARFGRSDLGVNERRVERWLADFRLGG